MSVNYRSRSSPVAVALLTCFAVTLLSAPAWAYRPFVGTDAAVAETGEVEIELQPAGFLKDGSEKLLVAPATIVNFGLPDFWELVLEGQVERLLPTSRPDAAFTDAAASLKHVLRPGSLQDGSGPSIATEVGALLPGIHAPRGVGVSLAGIVSQRFGWGTIHCNTATVLTRDHHANLFVGTILEGPSTWTVRPVAEIFYDETFGPQAFRSRTVSGLVGAIWQFSDEVAFDIAFRHGRDLAIRQDVNEIRAGVEFAFPIWPGSMPPAHREEYGPRQASR